MATLPAHYFLWHTGKASSFYGSEREFALRLMKLSHASRYNEEAVIREFALILMKLSHAFRYNEEAESRTV